MSDLPYPDTPQPDIPVPPQPDVPTPMPETEPEPDEEPDLFPPEPSEPPGDDVPKVGQWSLVRPEQEVMRDVGSATARHSFAAAT
jgi:hypothetical protein